MGVEPPATTWQLEAAAEDHDHDLWAIGADLEPGTIVAAYRLGLFPMRVPASSDDAVAPLGWWSPAVRGVIPLGTRPARTLRRIRGRYEVRVDVSFEEVVRGCGDPVREHGWIDETFVEAYTTLHRLGWAHSVECWDAEGLAGGLYGVAIGGLFAAESMFQLRPDAGKRALLGLIDLLQGSADASTRLLDVQWLTPHLELLGAIEITRAEYHRRLEAAIRLTQPLGLGG
jgi:leucyl/phenylalanyl-tRNA---protein transferase